MKEIIKKQKVIIEELCLKIICNKCGNTVSSKNNEESYTEHLTLKYSGGYFSNFPGDLCEVEFELCDKCLKEFVDTFSIRPSYRNLMTGKKEVDSYHKEKMKQRFFGFKISADINNRQFLEDICFAILRESVTQEYVVGASDSDIISFLLSEKDLSYLDYIHYISEDTSIIGVYNWVGNDDDFCDHGEKDFFNSVVPTEVKDVLEKHSFTPEFFFVQDL